MVRSVAPKWPENPWVGGARGAFSAISILNGTSALLPPFRALIDSWLGHQRPPEATQIHPPGYQHGNNGKKECSQPSEPLQCSNGGALLIFRV